IYFLMKLAFLPGSLLLEEAADGSYVVTIRGEEVTRTSSEKNAIQAFNKLRAEMEKLFPPTEISKEERTRLLIQYVGQSQTVSKFARVRKKKYVPGSTNTFG